MSVVKTSFDSPLRLDHVPVPLDGSGKIYITICPGKKCWSSTGAFSWDRDLKQDISAIKNYGVSAVVSLLDAKEHEAVGVPDLYTAYSDAGLEVFRVPTADGEYPYDGIRDAGRVWDEAVCTGKNIAVHCLGGLGRAGSFVATMLVRGMSFDPERAIEHVRRYREGAIETQEQRIGIYQSEDWNYSEAMGGQA